VNLISIRHFWISLVC